MRRFSSLLAAFGIILLASCDTLDSPILEPDATRPAITDGRDLGTGVYLLPPISDNDFTRTGPFDVNADPRVEICRLVPGAGDGTALTEANVESWECAEEPSLWFETDAAHDGATFIDVSPAPGGTAISDSMFSVGWKTNTGDANEAFRATILVPSLNVDGGAISVEYLETARFDAVLYDNASTKLDSDRIVGFNAGQNFPIKFIVEESAGCDGLDCYAYEVTCETGLFETEHAGALLPEDWAGECDVDVPGPERTWWLFQERLPYGSICPVGTGIDGIPFEPCYIWQLVEEVDGEGDASTFVPYTEEFREPVTVQFCNNPEGMDTGEGGVPEFLVPLTGVFRYSTNPGKTPPFEVALVPGAEEDILSNPTPCPYDGPIANPGLLGLGTLVDGVVRPVLELMGLEPRRLYAGDTGTLSAKTIRMSHFQRVLQLELEATTDLAPAVVIGGTQELGVRLTTPPHHDPLDGPSAGVPGTVVQFEIVSGEGSLDAPEAVSCGTGCIQVTTSLNDPNETTDEGGYAVAILTVGGSAGLLEVEVTVPADPDFPTLTFGVDAVDLFATFLEPLETGDFAGAPDELFTPTILICAESLTPCDANSAETVIETPDIKLVEEKGRKFYQADWKPRDTGTAEGGTYVAQILAEGVTVGYSIPIVVTKGGKSERLEGVYYNGANSSLPLKFTITRVDTP